jgi:hypothetical protein
VTPHTLTITLETLLPLKGCMSPEQLERFGDYLRHIEPLQPLQPKKLRTGELNKKLDDQCPPDGNTACWKGGLELRSRNNKNYTSRFQIIADELEKWKHDTVLDWRDGWVSGNDFTTINKTLMLNTKSEKDLRSQSDNAISRFIK